MRDKQAEYQRRGAESLIVMAQEPFQLKRPKEGASSFSWPREIPAMVLFDPLSTVSATYGVAFQTQFRGGQGPWSSKPAIFDGDLESGTPLREVAIAASLGVSRPTVREALTVLVAEGLATREVTS